MNMDFYKNLAASDLANFENLLAKKLGFLSDSARRDQLAQILTARLRATGNSDASRYFRLLNDPSCAFSELQAIADQLAVKETYFFRGLDHWQALVNRVLPDLVAKCTASRRLRILCAGCSSGEEPYTLAILLREQLQIDDAWSLDILGIDISPTAIEKARNGRYSAWSLRNTEDFIKTRYFRQAGQQFELSGDIRSSVRFEVRNILDDDPLFWHSGAFDLIFCRNVFIYFTMPAVALVVNRFAQALIPGGYLFLGHSETLRGISRAFHLRSDANTFFYQRRHPEEPLESSATFELWQQALQTSYSSAENIPAGEDSPPIPWVPDDSWVETTQRVSERIEQITAQRQKNSATAVPLSPLDWAHVMDLYSCERYAEVEKLLETPAWSENRDALLLRAVVLTNHGRLQEAEKVCKTLLVADEFNAGASYLLALCCEHAGNLASAETHLQSAAYLDPKFAMPHLQLGRLARRCGKLDIAQQYFSKALELLALEDSARLLLFGGGFSRAMLSIICRDELIACGGNP